MCRCRLSTTFAHVVGPRHWENAVCSPGHDACRCRPFVASPLSASWPSAWRAQEEPHQSLLGAARQLRQAAPSARQLHSARRYSVQARRERGRAASTAAARGVRRRSAAAAGSARPGRRRGSRAGRGDTSDLGDHLVGQGHQVPLSTAISWHPARRPDSGRVWR